MKRDRFASSVRGRPDGVPAPAPPAIAEDVQPGDIADEDGRRGRRAGQEARPASPSRREQKAIVRDLDELIASLEKQCQHCRNGIKRNNPNRGMDDSMISRGHRRDRRPRRPRRRRQGLGQALGPRARPHPPVDVRGLPARVPHRPRTLLPPPGRGEVGEGRGRRGEGQGTGRDRQALIAAGRVAWATDEDRISHR